MLIDMGAHKCSSLLMESHGQLGGRNAKVVLELEAILPEAWQPKNRPHIDDPIVEYGGVYCTYSPFFLVYYDPLNIIYCNLLNRIRIEHLRIRPP